MKVAENAIGGHVGCRTGQQKGQRSTGGGAADDQHGCQGSGSECADVEGETQQCEGRNLQPAGDHRERIAVFYHRFEQRRQRQSQHDPGRGAVYQIAEANSQTSDDFLTERYRVIVSGSF